MKKINMIIVGLGLHSRSLYLPVLCKYKEKFNVDIKLGVDLKDQENIIRNYLLTKNMEMELYFINPFNWAENLPVELDVYLTDFVKQFNIEAVLISTEPLCHKAYAKWALRNGLHILMDKPISTRENPVSDMEQAIGIYKDYQDLKNLYDNLQKNKKTIFSINAQRRYHICHQKIISLIKEVANKFDAPVTSIQSSHADGQWRMPSEIAAPITHPFCQGYGKCSHSGYHFFDILHQYYLAGQRENKAPDVLQLMTSFVKPRGFLMQFNEKNYFDYFGEAYKNTKLSNDSNLSSIFENYGEIDASILLRFIKNGENICNSTINLLHNSFSRRAWLKPREDLYKKNGRVKHEYHSIQQGPFQNIQVHSYQSNDDHSVNNEADYLLGGNNHFDIYVFRNSVMFDKDELPLRIYKLKDLDLNKNYNENELSNDLAKEFVLTEFFGFIRGRINKNQLISNIDSHSISVKIMSYVYRSHINQIQGDSPLVEFKLMKE